MHAENEEGDEVRVRRKGARKGEPDQAPPERVGANAIGAKTCMHGCGRGRSEWASHNGGMRNTDTDARHASAKRYTHTYTAQHCHKLRAQKAGRGS